MPDAQTRPVPSPGRARWRRAAYRLVRALILWPVRWRLAARMEKIPRLPWPALVLPNHTADVDILLMAVASPTPLYFMAAEQLFQRPLAGWLLRTLFDPIVKRKGAADLRAVRDVLTRVRQGHSVCLFPEGNTTFDGQTGPIAPSIGRLAAACGAGLVTYRTQGGYFSCPRWGHSLRRGRVTGRPVRILPPEQVRAMSADTLTDLIRHDLCNDAYAPGAGKPARYRGRRLAEGLPNALYLCPACGGMGTLTAAGDRFSCACGLSGVYADTGRLSGVPFDTIAAWCAWQQDELVRRALSAPGTAVIAEEGQTLYAVDARGALSQMAAGTLRMGTRALSLGDFRVDMGDVTGLELFRRNTVMFSTRDGGYYQIGSPRERSGLPLRDLFRALQDRKG